MFNECAFMCCFVVSHSSTVVQGAIVVFWLIVLLQPTVVTGSGFVFSAVGG